MKGEMDLEKLLGSISPELIDGEFVFCTFQTAGYGDHMDLEPVATIQESEGLTLIIPKSLADNNKLDYESVFNRITLNVHSSLDAVGLTAVFSGKLAENGISANVISGYYHDHIFVQKEFATKALGALNDLAC